MTSINDTLTELLSVDGARAVAIVDSGSGMVLGKAGSGMDLDIAAAGNTEVIRAKLSTIKALGLTDTIDDILITLSGQYHILRPLAKNPAVFIYLVLDRTKSNLALARMKVVSADTNLVF